MHKIVVRGFDNCWFIDVPGFRVDIRPYLRDRPVQICAKRVIIKISVGLRESSGHRGLDGHDFGLGGVQAGTDFHVGLDG